MDRLSRISIFIRVAEDGSFSAAARSLKTTQPTISKAIADLERTLDVRLLNRTTRKLSLTEVGTAYYQRTKHLIGLLEDADREAVTGKDSIQGRLRVNTSAMLSGKLVVPALVAFKAAYPAVNVELTVEDRRIDPVEHATDVAVRTGSLSNSSLRARRAGSATLGIFGAPSYFERMGVAPEDVSSLAGHHVIPYAEQKRSTDLGAAEAIVAFTVSNALSARDVMLAGIGLAAVPSFLVAEDLAAGRLVQVLRQVELPQTEVHLLHPFHQDAPRSVSAFVDFAITAWRRDGLLHS